MIDRCSLQHFLFATVFVFALAPQAARAADDEAGNTGRQAIAPIERSDDDSPDRALPRQTRIDIGAAQTTERNPRVLFITKTGCPVCEQELARLRRRGGDFEAMQARGWKIGESSDSHVQIVDREAIPDLVRQLNVREFPAVSCIHDGQIVRSFKSGCTTPLDCWTFGWLLKGENERPKVHVPEAVKVESTGSYRLRGNHWSIDGDWN